MGFSKQLELYLDQRLGSAAKKKQRADATGLDYDYYVMIAAGKKNPPSDDKIIDVAKKLSLSTGETSELLILAAKDRAKEEPTRQAWGYLERLIDQLINPDTGFKPASIALKPDTNLTDDEKLLVSLYRRLFPDDRAEIRGEIRGMLKAEKYQDDPGSDLKKVG